MGTKADTFRQRLIAREPLAGTFLKTPSPVTAEILGLSPLDVVCVDTEHAPFGRLEVDSCIGALRAADMPSLVRVASHSPHDIRNALDSGATGILVPHVTTADEARAIVKSAHFGEGGRGYAGSPRAAGYTTRSMQQHLADSRERTTVVVQIEDLAALANVAEIAAVDGVDALFVGRVDLAVAMQEAVSAERVVEAVRQICEQCVATDTAIGMFTPNLDELADWFERGASLFLLGSDQSFLLDGADALARSVRR